MAVLAFTKPGEKVIVQPPVYFPFFTAVKNHQRELVYNPLIEKEGKYYMDFVDLEKKIDKKTRLLFLCHPHNPVGRLWSPGELKTLAEICIRKNVLIVADEIHSDLILNGNVHVPFASLSDETAKISLTTISPSKTFNLACLSTDALIIPDPEIKKLYEKILDDLHIGMGNIFGNISLEAAYNHGDQWLSELLDYLNTNLRILNEFLSLKIPGIRVIQPEATYLVWLDFRGLGMNHKKLKDLIIHKAKLGLGDGMLFGPGGRGFQRINIALPSSGLLLALERLEKALML
jgi:cystathionine beta-lyase